MNSIKSFRTPVTLPAVVTFYYEPTAGNGFSLVGGNRASHQIFISHQVRLINTILGGLRGLLHKKAMEIAGQNRMIRPSDLQHLQNIADRLLAAELIDNATRDKLNYQIDLVFHALFGSTQISPNLTSKDLTNE